MTEVTRNKVLERGYLWDYSEPSELVLLRMVKFINGEKASELAEPSFYKVQRRRADPSFVQSTMTVRKPALGRMVISWLRRDIATLVPEKPVSINIKWNDSAHELFAKLKEATGVHFSSRDLLDTPIPENLMMQNQPFTLKIAENSLLYYGQFTVLLTTEG